MAASFTGNSGSGFRTTLGTTLNLSSFNVTAGNDVLIAISHRNDTTNADLQPTQTNTTFSFTDTATPANVSATLEAFTRHADPTTGLVRFVYTWLYKLHIATSKTGDVITVTINSPFTNPQLFSVAAGEYSGLSGGTFETDTYANNVSGIDSNPQQDISIYDSGTFQGVVELGATLNTSRRWCMAGRGALVGGSVFAATALGFQSLSGDTAITNTGSGTVRVAAIPTIDSSSAVLIDNTGFTFGTGTVRETQFPAVPAITGPNTRETQFPVDAAIAGPITRETQFPVDAAIAGPIARETQFAVVVAVPYVRDVPLVSLPDANKNLLRRRHEDLSIRIDVDKHSRPRVFIIT